MHEIAGAEPRREQRPGEPPKIRSSALGLVDRSGRHEDTAERRHRRCDETAKGRILPLQFDQRGFAGQRQFGQASPIDYILRVHCGEQTAIRRRALLRRGDDLRQRRHQNRLALGRIACFERIVELRLHPSLL